MRLREFNPFAAFHRMLVQTTNISSALILAVGGLGFISHVLYGIVWLQVHPADYENLWLRVIGAVTCFPLLLHKWWPPFWKKLLPWYWFFVVMYSLPFFSTYLLLASNYALNRSMMMMAMLFFVVAVLPHPVVLITNVIVGMALGIGWAHHTMPDFSSLAHGQLSTVYLPMFVFTIGASLVFSRSNLKGILAQEQIKAVEALALAGSIAHEVRSPLAQLKASLSTISRKLPPPGTDSKPHLLSARELESLYAELAHGSVAVERGLQVITMTLDEVYSRPVDPSRMGYRSAAAATRKAVDEFNYEHPLDREKVTVRVLEDFTFKGDETRYVLVLFNLLKNALYYFRELPQARVEVIVQANSVVFHDTGPGMDSKVLARLFEPFHTVGKPGGTGLGLAFCKRTMNAFGGDITCESVRGKYTRFTLRFPEVTAQELATHRHEKLQQGMRLFEGRRLLLVDDLAMVRASTRALLAPLHVAVDEAEDGPTALRRLSGADHAAMILDLSMPGMDGYAIARSVRGGAIPGKEHLPIVVYTAESPSIARVKLDNVGVDAFVQKPCTELELIDALCGAAEASHRRTEMARIAAGLRGLTILLADDEPLNRVYLRAVLRERGANIIEAGTGAEVLARMREAGKVDAVITDINMPGMSGMELARAIRAMEPPLAGTAVIALTGHSDEKTIAEARAAGMNDFLVKPVEPAELIERLSRYLGFGASDAQPAFALPPAGHVDARPPAAAPTDVPLLDTARIERMRTLDLLDELLPEALASAGSLLTRLQALRAARNSEGMQDAVHALIGIAGEMGANALRLELRAIYGAFVNSGEWPQDPQWVERAMHRLAQTEHAIRGEHLAQVR